MLMDFDGFDGRGVNFIISARGLSERHKRFGDRSLYISPLAGLCLLAARLPSSSTGRCEHLCRARQNLQPGCEQKLSTMDPSETVLNFYIASTCNESKEPSRVRAGWVALLHTNTCAIEFQRPLCLKCDHGRQTKLRALLRCISFVATTAHELSKVGSREPENRSLCDARPLGGDKFAVVMRTPEKSGSLARLGRGLYGAHKELHHSIQNISKCIRQLNVSLRIIDESAEDNVMKYAIDLADYAYEDAASAYCISCDYKCGGDFSEMIEHLKKAHLNRDPTEEAVRAAEFAGKHAWSICGNCGTAFLYTDELLEHRRRCPKVDRGRHKLA